MFLAEADLTLHITRGDTGEIVVRAVDGATEGGETPYIFKAGEVLRLKVTEKKNCNNVVLQKDFPVVQETETVTLALTEADTKIGDTISRPTDYWYEIELNPFSNPQTIVGYDEEGAKILRLYPEGEDAEVIQPTPEELGTVDKDLSLTSQNAIQNQAVARAIVQLTTTVEQNDKTATEEITVAKDKLSTLEEELAVERARINTFTALPEGSTMGDAEVMDARVGYDGTTYPSLGESIRGQVKSVEKTISNVVQMVKSENLFNKDDDKNQDGYVLQGDPLKPVSMSGYKVSHPIKADVGTYTFHTKIAMLGSTNALSVAHCDRDGNITGRRFLATDNGNNTATFTVDDTWGNTHFMVSVCNADLDTFMIVKGDTMPSEYVPYFEPYAKFKDNVQLPSFVLTHSSIADSVGYSETEVMSQKAVTEELDTIREKVESVNLFDKNSSSNQDGYLIQGDPSLVKPLSGFTVTHPIKAVVGNKYTFHYNKTMLGSTNGLTVARCDEQGNITGRRFLAEDNGDNTATFTVDSSFTGGYFMVTVYNPDLDTFMVVKGDTMPSEYSAYGESYIALKEELLAPLYEKLTGGGDNPLKGKKLSVNGDSICYGAGASGGYGKIIADTYGMTLQNLGVSGGTITAETHTPDGGNRYWICRTIANMDADSDYAIVEGGVNDASPSVGVTLGTISNGYDATLDDTTFYGAFESMCKQLILRFAGKKVGYIAVHKMITTFSSDGDEATNYYWAAKKCCEKWGIPFLDLNIACPPFGLIRNDDTILYPLKENYTSGADGWHPNEEGYKKYYVPKIVEWLKSL